MIEMPKFIYGTAWKTTATTKLVKLAINQGFLAIDTANQPKHYSEQGVGDALAELTKVGINREQLFLQTKFTPVNGQDKNIPYDPRESLTTQVQSSFNSSLEHLRTDYVNSYLLHGPYTWPGLSDADWEVWEAIEKIYTSGKAKLIGISNVNLEQLQLLTLTAKVKPMIVQNRCFANQRWDSAIRAFCKDHHIIYQGFSLLTANTNMLQQPAVKKIAQRLGKTPAQIIFRFAMHIGITPLTGTSNSQHMQEDLGVLDFKLAADDIATINAINP